MNLTYSTHKCQICNAQQSDNVDYLLNEHEMEDLLHKIWSGEVGIYNLPTGFYIKTAKDIESGLYEGFGDDMTTVESGTPDATLLTDFRKNVWLFSAAKTYQLVRTLNENRQEKGEYVSFVRFKNTSMPTLADFTGSYLMAEKELAKLSGTSGRKWNNIEKKKTDYPWLEYKTMRDGRVRPAHIYLDGIIQQVGTPFWRTFYPPNGWNCRCTTVEWKEGMGTDMKDFDMEEAYQNVPPEFRMNCGLTRKVFSPKHPYFKVPKQDREFARKNFNLPYPHGN